MTSGQFSFPDSASLSLPPINGLPTSDGLSVASPQSAGSTREPSVAELVAQANERNRLNDLATAARQRYETILAENNNDRSAPAVEAAFAEFQRANRAANAALDVGVPPDPVTTGRQLISRDF